MDLRAEVVGSESRRRESWAIRAERCVSVSVVIYSVASVREEVVVGVVVYLLKYLM